jgi:AraC-like DNA-binding protein
MYVEEGTHRVLVDGELFTLQAGQAILYAPNAYHIGPAPSEALVDIVSFESDLAALPTLCNRVLTLNAAQKQLLSRIMTQGLRDFTQLPKGGERYGFVPRPEVSALELMRLKNNLELLLIDLCMAEAPQHPTVAASNQENHQVQQLTAVMNFLKGQLHRSLTQEEIAAECGLSVSSLKALFHKQLGCGVITYFLALKIGEAKRLICDSPLNITQIAEALGFGSIHYFSKLFKEKTGLSPTEYAKTIDKR